MSPLPELGMRLLSKEMSLRLDTPVGFASRSPPAAATSFLHFRFHLYPQGDLRLPGGILCIPALWIPLGFLVCSNGACGASQILRLPPHLSHSTGHSPQCPPSSSHCLCPPVLLKDAPAALGTPRTYPGSSIPNSLIPNSPPSPPRDREQRAQKAAKSGSLERAGAAPAPAPGETKGAEDGLFSPGMRRDGANTTGSWGGRGGG